MAVTRLGWIPLAILVSLLTGTLADRAVPTRVWTAGGYRILSADLHVHSGLWGGATMTPWGLVLEARRQGLDVVALTSHNEILDGRLAAVFSERMAGPIVLVGQEITSATQDLIAIGITSTIAPELPLAAQVTEVHRQGGIAIAPHPSGRYLDRYRPVLAAIDGAEVCHPVIWQVRTAGTELERFFAATTAMPIGSSDFHFLRSPGLCRTFIFARDATVPAVMDALRARRTVVFGPNGKVFGEPALVALAQSVGAREDAVAYARDRAGILEWISRGTMVCGLLGLAVRFRRQSSHRPAGSRGSGPLAPAQSRSRRSFPPGP